MCAGLVCWLCAQRRFSWSSQSDESGVIAWKVAAGQRLVDHLLGRHLDQGDLHRLAVRRALVLGVELVGQALDQRRLLRRIGDGQRGVARIGMSTVPLPLAAGCVDGIRLTSPADASGNASSTQQIATPRRRTIRERRWSCARLSCSSFAIGLRSHGYLPTFRSNQRSSASSTSRLGEAMRVRARHDRLDALVFATA